MFAPILPRPTIPIFIPSSPSLLIRLQSRYPTRSFLFRCGESEHWSTVMR